MNLRKEVVPVHITLKEAAAKMLEAENLVITTHVNPDGDALGSSLALYQMLVRLGKNVEVLIDDDVPESFGFLPDIEAIQKPEKESYPADYLIMLDVSKDRIGQVLNKCQAPSINIDHHRTNDGEQLQQVMHGDCPHKSIRRNHSIESESCVQNEKQDGFPSHHRSLFLLMPHGYKSLHNGNQTKPP